MARKKRRKKNKNSPRKARKLPGFNVDLPRETKELIGGVIMFSAAIIVCLAFLGKAGIVGEKLISLGNNLIGNTIYTIPLFLILTGIVFFNTKYKRILGPLILAILILILGISGILACLNPEVREGGIIGHISSFALLNLFGLEVTMIIFLTLIIIGILIFWQLLLPRLSEREESIDKLGIEKEKKTVLTRIFGRKTKDPKFKIKEIVGQTPEKVSETKHQKSNLELKVDKVPQNALFSKYKVPPLDLLDQNHDKPNAGNIKANAIIIQKTLENFGIPVKMAEINIGPTVTQYTFKPAEGIKLSKITGLSNNLALGLASHPIRIEAPVPGRSLVGIEVPNKVRVTVRLKDLISEPFFKNSPAMTLPLGKDVAGSPSYANLSRMPHLLVAGATGTGKTIFLNSLISSLLYQNGPELLRLILVDPKRVEFNTYNEIPHILCPVIYDAQKTVNCLNWLINEMGRRFEILSAEKVKNITAYNEKMLKDGREIMPYIVFIVDELADLIMAKGREIEVRIVRLAQLARAVGIHLVLATQRPSVEVLTGLIKANITSRISFQVASQIDSRTVLDVSGAEKLLGQGDLLFISAQVVKPKRIQGSYMSEKEVKRVVKWIAENNENILPEDELSEELKAELDKTIVDVSGLGYNGPGAIGDDSLYEEAKRIVIEAKKASASFLQRKLRIGYARAARLLDMLEARGMVGPSDGAKPRKILAMEEESQEQVNFENDYDENV